MNWPPPEARLESLFRDLAPRVLGGLVRSFHDLASCEDAVQEALIAAAAQWPHEGVPEDPRAWLNRVARRRIVDHLRSDDARRRREAAASGETKFALPEVVGEPGSERDDTLALLFMCCHPALSPGSAIALTLRAIGGLTTAEIARAFLVPEATMAQRISRAKQSIKASGIRFLEPSPSERGERLGSVLHVLYLMFSEGYSSSAGSDLYRTDLSTEAIRLTRNVHQLLPDDPEVAGLLALMLLTEARRDARTGPRGELVPLDEQNRALWSSEAIAEGVMLVSASLRRGRVGEYQLLAAIAAVHGEAARAEETDWPQILALYELLSKMSNNPMVALSHAVAFAMVHGPGAGLRRVAVLEDDERLRGSHRLDAVRAHLLEREGDLEAAASSYRVAAEKSTNLAERDYLMLRAARMCEE